MTTKTYAPRPRDIERRWYVMDAEGAVLGRLASEVAKLLRGKHKPMFAPHMDTGDHVIVVNARGVRLTGGKDVSKTYYRHSGYPGGIREMNAARLLSERPATVVERAVRGMLPKNRLGRAMFKKLSVYEGPEHPHQAQKPTSIGVGEIPKWEGLPAPATSLAPTPAPRSRPSRASRRSPAPAKPEASTKPARGRRPKAEGGDGSGAAPAAAATKTPRGRARASASKEKSVEARKPGTSRTSRTSKES